MLLWGLLAVGGTASAQSADEPAAESSCVLCHGEAELWEGETLRLYVTEKHLQDDIHWQKGIRCHDCHGGDPGTNNFRQAHSPDAGFRAIASPRDVPQFCGHCHSDVAYMSRFRPSPKTNQVPDYLTSGHGRALTEKPDAQSAHCVSCHGGHGIRAVKDLESPVYPTRLARTCATCHADPDKMAGIEYHGHPIGHNQYEEWKSSVHARAMLEQGDLSAPTCNDCHGNHGTLPADVGSVAGACGTCHVKIGQLFGQTRMKHQFEEAQLPGCATCHGKHEIHHPTDEMLGMQAGGTCAKCHADGKFGATLAGSQEARAMRAGLDQLKGLIAEAESKLDEAERLGMEVRVARFRLRDARESLTNSRTLIHSFDAQAMQTELQQGREVGADVRRQAEAAIEQYTYRRIWLGVSLAPILLAAALLLAYIKTHPPSDTAPERTIKDEG